MPGKTAGFPPYRADMATQSNPAPAGNPEPTGVRPAILCAATRMARGWRSAAGWACTLTVLVRGAVVPFVELAGGGPVSPFDWVSVAALLGALGLARYRHLEAATQEQDQEG